LQQEACYLKDNRKVNTPIAVNTRKLVVTFSKNYVDLNFSFK